MFYIKGNYMYLTQGDSAVIRVRLKDQTGGEYIMRTGDTATLTIRSKVNGSLIGEFSSTAANNAAYIDISISDIESSGLSVGQYAADVRFNTSDNSYYCTIFPTWSPDKESRKLKGLDSDWGNFIVTPSLVD